MLETSYVFVGEMTENSAIIAQGALAVYVTEYEISLRKHVDDMFRGKSLSVHPFNPKMFWEAAIIEQGYQINMQGNGLGVYTNGPLGHPGDGEYEIYDVLKTSISGKYRKARLNIEIEVNTSRGKEVCHFAKEESEETLRALKVVVQFLVPKDKLKEFLGLNDSNVKYFMEKLDAIG
jgi:hypothetical protein